MTTPKNGLLFHFTHIDNLASVVSAGLSCDAVMVQSPNAFVNVGNQVIKARRRRRPVPDPHGGVVADYVPFYFAARSPMLYAIHMKNVQTYQGTQDEVAYLVTSTEAVVEQGLPFVYTDRNASMAVAKFSSDLAEIDSLVDWDLMRRRMFRNTDSDSDRVERRMAEFLVRDHVPWDTFIGVAVKNESRAQQVSGILTSLGVDQVPIRTRPDWYF